MQYRFFALPLLLVAAWSIYLLAAWVPSAVAQEMRTDVGVEQTGPRALGSPSAQDQVESWITENVDPAEQNSTTPAGVAPPSVPAGLTREADMAQVDWGAGRITAMGVAEAPGDGLNPARAEALAIRKSTLQARKLLQDAVFALRLDGRHLVGDVLTPQQQTDLRGKLQNSPITRHNVPDGLGGVRVEVEAEAVLRGALAEALIPSTVAFQSRIPPIIELTVDVSTQVAADVEQLEYRQSMVELGAFTGVIVDARGLEGAPALLPVVTGPDGKAAFGPFGAARSLVLSDGLAVYVQSPQDVAARNRVGSTPLVVRALAVSGAHRADLVVSEADAELIRQLFHSPEMTAACPVAIVLD